MGTPKNKHPYKRLWRNLLLNKRYQLRFTLFMVGLSAALMVLLGWWVMTVARAATTVAENNVLGDEVCQDPAATQADQDQPTPAAADKNHLIGMEHGAAPAAGGDDSAAAAGDQAEAPAAGDQAAAPAGDQAAAPAAGDQAAAPAGDQVAAPAAGGDDSAAGGDATAGQPARSRPVVHIEESDMQMVGTPPPVNAPASAPASHAAYEQCKRDQAVKLLEIETRQELIFWVLVAVGTLMCLGLLFYGIKMTHRVAGPLHKVGLYLDKLKDGHYAQVYNLRKGDRLVDFYEHFKHGYAGVRAMQEADVARLKALLEAADQAELASRSPELAAALADLRALLERKEKSLA